MKVVKNFLILDTIRHLESVTLRSTTTNIDKSAGLPARTDLLLWKVSDTCGCTPSLNLWHYQRVLSQLTSCPKSKPKIQKASHSVKFLKHLLPKLNIAFRFNRGKNMNLKSVCRPADQQTARPSGTRGQFTQVYVHRKCLWSCWVNPTFRTCAKKEIPSPVPTAVLATCCILRQTM